MLCEKLRRTRKNKKWTYSTQEYSLINIVEIFHSHAQFVFLWLFESLCSSNLLWQLIKCKKIKNLKKIVPVADIFFMQGIPFVLYWGVLVQENDAERGGESESSLMQSVQGLNANQTGLSPCLAYSSAHTSCQPLQWYTHPATHMHYRSKDSINKSSLVTFALLVE